MCSIGDLLAYLAAPSPHGTATAVMVEVMDPGEDPLGIHTGPHPWIRAEKAVYVVGIPRRGIMGAPVLVYGSVEDAAEVVRGTDGEILDLERLKAWWSALQEDRAGHAEKGAHR